MSKYSKLEFAGNDWSARGRKPSLDPVLPAAGALILVDFAHPANGTDFKTGAFVQGDVLQNLAATQAAAAIGSGDATSLKVAVKVGTAAATALRTERTSKGGFHVFTRKDADPTSQAFTQLVAPSLIKDFVFTNSGTGSSDVKHKFYASTWFRLTRKAVSTIDGTSVSNNRPAAGGSWGNPPSTNYLYAYGEQSIAPLGADGSNYTPAMWFDGALGSPQHPSVATRGYWGGTKPGSSVDIELAGQGVSGGMYSYAAAPARRAVGDRVLYRCYLEDLTVSGRSYAQVYALDHAQFVKDTTLGGRFYNDTYTDPTTVFAASA